MAAELFGSWSYWTKYFSRPFYKHGLTLIPAWIRNNTNWNVWDKITYPFPNFKGCNHWSLGLDMEFNPTIYGDPTLYGWLLIHAEIQIMYNHTFVKRCIYITFIQYIYIMIICSHPRLVSLTQNAACMYGNYIYIYIHTLSIWQFHILTLAQQQWYKPTDFVRCRGHHENLRSTCPWTSDMATALVQTTCLHIQAE